MSISPLDTVRKLLAAIEADDEAALSALLSDALVQTEHPNLLVPKGAVRDRSDVLRARFAIFVVVRDGRIVEQQNYDCFLPA